MTGAGEAGGGASARPPRTSSNDQPPAATDRIQGQVLLTDGSPVGGATVEARALHIFDEWDTAGRDQARVLTGAAGQFELRDLRLGDYELTVTGPGAQPAVTSATVRTGSEQVRLVLGRMVEIWVDGQVTSRTGGPVAGAMVTADGLDTQVESGADGTFRFLIEVPDHQLVGVGLAREGFEPARVSLDPAARDAQGVVQVDVTLAPTEGQLTVAGRVVDAAGQGLSGKSVYLSGDGSKHRAKTDAAGGFVIDGIRNPGRYVLSVSADGVHTGHRDLAFQVPEAGVQGHTIALERVDVGHVHGVMLDTDGRPLPGFTLAIQSASAPSETISITSDAQGRFAAEKVPMGKLRIQSQSYPRFITSGLTLGAGEVLDVEVLIDQGDQQLTGRVTDEAGQPLAGVDLTLSWVRRDGGAVHESLRKTTTDRAGAFVFTRLGSGERDLIVRAPNHEPVRLGGVSPSRTEQVIIELPKVIQP